MHSINAPWNTTGNTAAGVVNVCQRIHSVLPQHPEDCPPLIFMHGFAGFNQIEAFSVPLLQYWRTFVEFFTQRGYKTFVAGVSPFHSPQVRASEWHRVIEAYRQQQQAEQVILIAHSQGAIDARLLVCPRTDPVVTTIGPLSGKGYGRYVDKLISLGGPHFGNVSVDVSGNNQDLDKVVKELLGLTTVIGSELLGKKQDMVAAVASLSQSFMLHEFNPYCLDDPSVDCYCLAGHPVSHTPKMPLMSQSYRDLLAITPAEGGGNNDGLVTVASALFGNGNTTEYGLPAGAKANRQWQVLGVVDLDHIGLIGLYPDFLPRKYQRYLEAVFHNQSLVDVSKTALTQYISVNRKRLLERLQFSVPAGADVQDETL